MGSPASADPILEGDSVSPKTALPNTQAPVPGTGYFPNDQNSANKTNDQANPLIGNAVISSSAEDQPDHPESLDSTREAEWRPVDKVTRKASSASVSFKRPKNPQLPQGDERHTDKERIRDASPPPERFRKHVAFDNLPIGEATKNNMPSLTLASKHVGYRAGRRSRTFMVGVDENSYSDYALQWLLDELVDDGDEVVCVRVLEKEVRVNDESYKTDAQAIMERIVEKNGDTRSLSFILEYATGKLHGTFQKLIQMHQPAMLVVGTRGRSLGGLQGLVNTRNSFSKYCLQYSPVPVVVVRPTEKRVKKKTKRANDVSRQTYISMLVATSGKHEADSEASSMYELEVGISPDEEAHQVAKVLGLPASFDPTLKPIDAALLRPSRPSGLASFLQNSDEVPEQNKPLVKDSVSLASAGSDSSDDEDDEAEGEFEVMSGTEALDHQKLEQLHKMEVGEAAALRRHADEDEDSDEDQPPSKESS